MTLADELRDVIARDDAFALRLLVRANESTILRAVQLLDRLAIGDDDGERAPREPVKAAPTIHCGWPDCECKERVCSRGFDADTAIGLREDAAPREPVKDLAQRQTTLGPEIEQVLAEHRGELYESEPEFDAGFTADRPREPVKDDK